MKIYFKTFGCRVNQIETESLREKILSYGNEETEKTEEADCLVVNTCSVTSKADRDVMVFLRKAYSDNPSCRIFVSGCFAELFPDKIRSAVPTAQIFKNADKEKIASALCGAAVAEDFSAVTGFYGRSRAFVKIQDGCNLKCSYCLVNMARSELRSKPMPSAVNEIKRLIEAGFAEIVLCGTRLGYYHCPETGADLNALMMKIFELPGNFRIRFSSMEITELNKPLLATLASAGSRFCNYFHLPLQAGSDNVLKAMNRPYSLARYSEMLSVLRNLFPDAGLYADIIAGFPSESEADFNESEKFVRKEKLSGLHIFSFSSRPGTRAAKMNQLKPCVIKERSRLLHETDALLRHNFAESQKGKLLQILVLHDKKGHPQGLTSNFLTVEIDNAEDRFENGQLAMAEITGIKKGIIYAKLKK